MILFLYLGRILMRNFFLVALLLWLISWLEKLSLIAGMTTNSIGTALPWLDKSLIAAVRATNDSLDFLPIMFMIAAVWSLTLIGRRAELHIIRGVGLSATRILLNLAVVTAMVTVIFTLIIRPLAYEAKVWADSVLTPQNLSAESNTYGRYSAWISSEDAGFIGRLSGYDPSQGIARDLFLSQNYRPGLEPIFLFATNVEITDLELSAVNINTSSTIALVLDEAPNILANLKPNQRLPLPHLLGWIDHDERWALNPRQKSYLVQRSLAEPVLAAVLVMIAGFLCVEVGTRQPIGMLIGSTLGIVVLVYSLYVIAHAFGLNGKSPPIVAAWALPAGLFTLSLGLISMRDLAWHIETREREFPH